MIISKQKEFKDILGSLKENNIFIIGCGKCAAKLCVGGEPELIEMENRLAEEGKNITGWTVLSSACSISSWKDVLSQNPEIEKSDALLVMSCGAGVSVISRFADMQVYPALDTRSLGGICCGEIIDKQCSMCGECELLFHGGVCPLSRCAKGLLNGPCGGSSEGKCEVYERECAWDAIYERLKKLGKLEYLEIIHEPKEHGRRWKA